MLKLIYKDFKSFEHVLIFQMVIIISMMSFAFFFDQNGNMTYIILLMYPMTLPITLLVMDEKYQTFCNSLPIKRQDYVLAKYVGGLLFASLIVTIGLAYGYIMTTYVLVDNVELNALFGINGFAMIAMPIIFINALVFPIFFAFSKEKGSVVLMVFLIVLLIAVLLTFVYLEKNLPAVEYYSKKEIFPVLIYHLSNYIEGIGKRAFLTRLVIGNGLVVIVSIVSSLFIFRFKNIGGAR